MGNMTEADIVGRTFHADERANLHAIPTLQAPLNVGNPGEVAAFLASYEWVVNLNSIAPEYRNLLAASGLMFRVLKDTQDFLEVLTGIIEQHGADEMVHACNNVMASAMLARRAAIEGLQVLSPAAK